MVAGIVKGLVEHGDATRHFGSLLGFGWHTALARDLGYVTLDESKVLLTESGRAYYELAGLQELPDVRAYFWTMKRDDWSPPNSQGNRTSPRSG